MMHMQEVTTVLLLLFFNAIALAPDGLFTDPVKDGCQILSGNEHLESNMVSGKTDGTLNSVGSVLRFLCKSGFELQGSAVLMCQQNTHYNSSVPTCQRTTQCSHPGIFSNGYYRYGRGYYTDGVDLPISAAIFADCNAGYRLHGKSERMCQSNGTWSGINPVCTSIQCSHPGTFSNGYYRYGRGYYTDEVDLPISAAIFADCNAGYRLHGKSERMCQSNGTWSGTNPVCNIIQCTFPDVFVNGSYAVGNAFIQSGQLFNFGFTVGAYCNKGYTPDDIGEHIRTCQADSTWSGNNPVCNIVYCNHTGNILNGYYLQDDNTSYISGRLPFQSVIIAHCEAGYKLQVNDNHRTCQSDGNWSGRIPVCNVITCTYPEYFPGGYYTDKNDPKYTSGISLPNSVINVNCNIGYELQGNNKQRTCHGDGLWRGSTPVCNKVNCSHPGFIEGTYYTYRNKSRYTTGMLPFGSVVRIRCSNGYNLSSGLQTMECTANGSWDNIVQICTPITCPWPDDFYGGQYQLESPIPLPNTPVSFGTTIQAVCENDLFTMATSPSLRSCTENGDWSGVQPICAPLCNVTTITNGHYAGNGSTRRDKYEAGEQIHPVCDDGYQLGRHLEDTFKTCGQNHLWDGPDATCSEIQHVDSKQQSASMSTIIGCVFGGFCIVIIVAVAVIVFIKYKRTLNVSTPKYEDFQMKNKQIVDDTCHEV